VLTLVEQRALDEPVDRGEAAENELEDARVEDVGEVDG
jgi:hypothetical protein